MVSSPAQQSKNWSKILASNVTLAQAPPESTPNPESYSVSDFKEELARRDAIIAHRERQIEAMRRTAEALSAHGSTDVLIKQALHLATAAVGADAGSLLLYDPLHHTLVFRYVIGAASDNLVGYSMPATKGIAGRVFRTGKPDISSDTKKRPDFNRNVDQKTGFHTHCMVTVPVKHQGGKAIGVLQIINYDESYDHYDLEVLEVVASQAALAIENARLLHQARKAELVNLIGDVSHDIKNMLTPIQTGVWTLEPMLSEMFKMLDDLFARDPDAEWTRRVRQATALVREEHGWILTNALSAAERVQERTREIADVIKGESSPPRFAHDDFNNLAREVYTSLRIVTYDHQIDLELDLDPALPLVEIDRKQMYNALYNLVNNAIPETPEGGLITIRTRVLGTTAPDFLVEISDTGRGMPPEICERLFTDAAVSTKPGGTGLGTRIVADVVRRHRGRISVKSNPGAGTTFTMLLPLAQSS